METNLMFNGMTKDETSETASVAGLSLAPHTAANEIENECRCEPSDYAPPAGYSGDGSVAALAAAAAQPAPDDIVSKLRSLKVLLGADSPEVRGWAPAVQQQAQKVVNEAIASFHAARQQQPAPLTREHISHLWDTRVGDPTPAYPLTFNDVYNFARAIEAALGITPADAPSPA